MSRGSNMLAVDRDGCIIHSTKSTLRPFMSAYCCGVR
jgi:histidinol phosphatase-like enzyme